MSVGSCLAEMFRSSSVTYIL